MAKAKYGIKVPFDGAYLWVTHNAFNEFDLKPVLYETEESARAAASIWGPAAIIEEYSVDNQ